MFSAVGLPLQVWPEARPGTAARRWAAAKGVALLALLPLDALSQTTGGANLPLSEAVTSSIVAEAAIPCRTIVRQASSTVSPSTTMASTSERLHRVIASAPAGLGLQRQTRLITSVFVGDSSNDDDTSLAK